MMKIVCSTICLKSFSSPGYIFRLAIAILMFGSLIACTATPTKPESESAASNVVTDSGMSGAADLYNSHNYPDALRAFDKVITDKGSSANDRRLANLGKSLVYLGSDADLHSIENAKLSLVSAGQVAPEQNEEFTVETDLLMDAVSAVIGTESKYVVMVAKSSGSGAEVVELRRELDGLKKERDELLAEQKVLNDTLEKLKKLTLGN